MKAKLPGYAGQILYVDLTTQKTETRPLPPELAREYLGGRGFVARLLWDEVPAGTDPLGPENRVVIAAGPLSGLFIPGAGKLHLGTKSPATGGYGDANVGGHLAPELKYAGYDAVVIRGVSEHPCVVVIDDGAVRFLDGSQWWGQGAIETETRLKAKLGHDFQIMTIGPAGEKLVKFACISHDFGRQAGRTGVGTVFGSKQLKAIAIRGSRDVPVADVKGVQEHGRKMYEVCFSKPGFEEWTPYGTAGVTDWVNEVGAFPTRNFQTSYFPEHERINGQRIREKILVTDKGCFGCPIPCGKYSRVKVQRGEAFVEGPEYETIALIGGNCALATIEEVGYANYVADELGLDTISAGNVAAFAIECYEKGLLTEEQVGRKLAWGCLDSVVFLLEAMAAREGIGDLLAEGVKTAASVIKGGSEKFAIHVKGLEWSGYEARYAPAMMLSYMTADVGAHHNRSWAITYDVAVGRETLEGKAEKVIELQHIRPLFDALGLCRLQWVEIGFELEHYAAIFPLVTGWDYSWTDLLAISERIWNLTRSFSAREIEGYGRDFDYPPARFYEEPIPDGPAQGRFIPKEQLEELLDRYYHLRGWDRRGLPTRAKLEKMGLQFVLDALGEKVS
ncbi:MAG: aldehyde ferredoxin oxidoreductase family protein [Bacillota bacterium]